MSTLLACNVETFANGGTCREQRRLVPSAWCNSCLESETGHIRDEQRELDARIPLGDDGLLDRERKAC